MIRIETNGPVRKEIAAVTGMDGVMIFVFGIIPAALLFLAAFAMQGERGLEDRDDQIRSSTVKAI